MADLRDIDYVAAVLARTVSGIHVRQSDEPIDVCRFHRELAEDVLDALASREGERTLGPPSAGPQASAVESATHRQPAATRESDAPREEQR